MSCSTRCLDLLRVQLPNVYSGSPTAGTSLQGYQGSIAMFLDCSVRSIFITLYVGKIGRLN